MNTLQVSTFSLLTSDDDYLAFLFVLFFFSPQTFYALGGAEVLLSAVAETGNAFFLSSDHLTNFTCEFRLMPSGNESNGFHIQSRAYIANTYQPQLKKTVMYW